MTLKSRHRWRLAQAQAQRQRPSPPTADPTQDAQAKSPQVCQHLKDRWQRKAIKRFGKQAPERANRTLRSVKRQPDLKTRRDPLAACGEYPQTCIGFKTCGACDFAATQASKEQREAFNGLTVDNPHLLWVMVVAVPVSWQLPVGSLHLCKAAKRLELVAQRVRRAGKEIPAIIGLDITLNTAKMASGNYKYWAPHANILVPLRYVPHVKSAVKSLARWAPLVPKPLKTRDVTDPVVGANYALKFDLSAVRGREQQQAEGNEFFHLMPWTSRLSSAEFDEFIRWRTTFPLTDLMKIVGISTSKKGWRILKK